MRSGDNDSESAMLSNPYAPLSGGRSDALSTSKPNKSRVAL